MTARFRFKLRPLTNYVFVAFIFGVFAIIVAMVVATMQASVLWAWLADIIAMAVLFFVYFHLLDKRAIFIRCENPKCRRSIGTNTPWICGFSNCLKTNEHIDEYPFSNCCEHCGTAPKAYKCHHCGELIFLTLDRLTHSYARCVDARPERKKRDTSAVQEEHETLRDEIHTTRLRTELEREKQTFEEVSKKTSERERELKTMMDGMQNKREKLTAIRKFRTDWRNEIAADKTISESERKTQLEDAERITEEAMMTHL
jgi:hypothetical protein